MTVTVGRPFERFTDSFARNCGCGRMAERAEIVVIILRNNALQYRLRCANCNGLPQGFYNIPPASLSAYERDMAIILKDNRDMKPCVRCGAMGGEDHHTSPYAAFKDADSWPVIRLCIPCHTEWHATMEAYYRRRFKEDKSNG